MKKELKIPIFDIIIKNLIFRKYNKGVVFMIKPVMLKQGDTIGVISTASPVAALCPNRFQRGIHELEKMGFKVKVGNHARNKIGHLAGTVEERLEDFHEMVQNPEVKAIINTIGGYNSHQLLEYIDYDLIQKNPKIFLGYSDFTSLLLAIHKKCNLITFMGPALLPQFGEYNGIFDYTKTMLQAVTMKKTDKLNISPSSFWTGEKLKWDVEDLRPRKMEQNTGPLTLRAGKAKGKILAGNMGTMLLLAGTDYLPSFENKILFLEEDEEEKPGTIDRYLTQLRHIGAFEKINGIVFGRFHPNVSFSNDYTFEDIVNEATKGFDFPIISNVDFGHTDPMITIPNGIEVEIEALFHQAQITFCENAVK